MRLFPLVKLFATALLAAAPALAQTAPAPKEGNTADWAIALHGGAGIISRAATTPEADKAIRLALAQALEAGKTILKAGGTATDAVQATVVHLEASPWFNAGVGAVFNSAGSVSLDAAIMDGQTLAAGAVTGVTTTQSPITLARTLMDKGPHVFLFGARADAYARSHQLPQVPNSYFHTERRRAQLQDLQHRNQGASLNLPPEIGPAEIDSAEIRMGTVGAVARDTRGNVAAATSTGGLTGKDPGRIGDSPIIGAGTLADNRCAAISATGSGEMFIRIRFAETICAAYRYQQASLQQATDKALAEVKAIGGDGGAIVVTTSGPALFGLNSQGMYRGRADSSGLFEIKVFGDE